VAAEPASHLRAVPSISIEQALTEQNTILHEQLAGADRELRAWRSRYARLEADVEAEARAIRSPSACFATGRR
jgi:hypothetical protein